MIISFCSTCMNRLEFLKQTMFINLELIEMFNDTYEHKFEIVLCNYDSKDNLDEYVKENLQKYIDTNLLVYVKTENKKYFHPAHAKNIAHLYSNGDVVINLDGDNFLTYDVVEYIYNIFTTNNIHEIFLTDDKYVGLVGLSKDNFIKLGGYNEKPTTFGYEDIDLQLRILKYLKCEKKILNPEFDYCLNNQIHHYDDIRLCNINMNTLSRKESEENNKKMMEFQLENNIINPNDYYGIIYGQI